MRRAAVSIPANIAEGFQRRGTADKVRLLNRIWTWHGSAKKVEAAMKEQEISKAEMARRTRTSRAALDRLLDPDNAGVTLATLQKAAEAVGREIRVKFIEGLHGR